MENAGGNPLALIELAGLLSDEQLAGRAPLPDPLPQSAEIERVYLERVRALPAAAQVLLLLVAADDTGSLATVFEAAATLGVEPDALESAEAAGLVRAFDGEVELRHPLVRSTLYRDATFAQRQAAHRALADVFGGEQDADRRAWHRAAASPGHDDEVADELEQTARRARHRSGSRPQPARSSARRSCRATTRSAGSGSWRPPRTPGSPAAPSRPWRCSIAPTGSSPTCAVRADVLHLRGTIGLRCGVPADAATILAAGAAEVAPSLPGRRSRCSSRPPRPPRMPATPRRSSSSAGAPRRCWSDDDPDERFTVDVIVGIGSLLAGDAASGVPLLREALALAAGFQDPGRLVHAGACAGYLGEEATEHELYGRAAARARETGQWRCCRTSSSSSPAPRRWTGATPRPPPTPARGWAWRTRPASRTRSATSTPRWR